MPLHHIQAKRFTLIKNQRRVRHIFLHFSFPSALPAISLTSINLLLPICPVFTVAEIRRHHSCLLQHGKLSSPHSAIHLQPLERGGGWKAAAAAAKAVFSYCFPVKHTQPRPSTSSAPVTTPMLECLDAGAPSRSSVSSGSWPGNPGSTDKRREEREGGMGEKAVEEEMEGWGGITACSVAPSAESQQHQPPNGSLIQKTRCVLTSRKTKKCNLGTGTYPVPTDVTDRENNTTDCTEREREDNEQYLHVSADSSRPGYKWKMTSSLEIHHTGNRPHSTSSSAPSLNDTLTKDQFLQFLYRSSVLRRGGLEQPRCLLHIGVCVCVHKQVCDKAPLTLTHAT